MTGVIINFTGVSPVFDFTAPLRNFSTTVQNALVCAGTQIGTDQVFTDRGTSLLADANRGGFTDLNGAQQSASFAGNDILIFTQLNDSSDNPFRLTNFKLEAVTLSNQTLNLTVSASSAGGDSVGISASM